MHIQPRVGVGVIVVKDNHVLLGKRKDTHGNGCYGPPGGHLHFKETVEECAIRELAEETSLTPLSFQLGPWTQNVIDEQKHYISLFVFVNAFAGEPVLLEPHRCEGWDWYPWDNLPSPLFIPMVTMMKSFGLENLKKMT